jgi:WD40 repeat protein
MGETVNVISCIAFSVNDRFLLAGTMKGELLVWDIESKRLALRIDAHHNHTAFVTEVAARVVTVGWTQSYAWDEQEKSECNVKVWTGNIDMLTKVAPSLKTVERHRSEVSAIAISEDDSEVVTGSYDRSVALWNVERIERKRSGRIRGIVNAVSLNKKANVYAALGNYAHDCGVVNVWSLSNGELLYEIETDDLGESVTFTRDGRHILIGTAMTLAVHATSDGSRARTIKLSNWEIESFHSGNLCCISEVLVAAGTRSGVVRFWDRTSGEKALEVKAHDSAIVGLFIADEQRLIISLSADGQIRLWNAKSGAPIGMLATAGLNIVAGAVSAKAPFLLTAGRDGTARVWDLGSGREVASFAVDSPLKSCAISSDGARVFLGDASGRVHFLQLEEC